MPDTTPVEATETPESILRLLDLALEQAEVHELLGARFLESHTLFETRSDQRRQIISWCQEFVGRLAARDSKLRVLSVGCGSGAVDLPLATSAVQSHRGVDYVGVNPNEVECDEFARAFEQESLPDSDLELVAAPFEAFETRRRFDLIHFVHSLYYMDDAAEALERALRMVAPGGRMVVFHAPREDLNDLAARFYAKLYGRPSLFAEDVEDVLQHRGWRFERERIDAQIDVTDLIENRRGVALALRDFILQVESDRLPEKAQTLVDKHLRAVATESRGRWSIDHPVNAYIVRVE